MKLTLIKQQTVETLNIMELIRSEYLLPNIIMILLGILSIFSIYFLIERFIILKKSSIKDSKFIDKINQHISENKIQEAVKLCKNNDTPIGRIVLRGLGEIKSSEDIIYKTIESQG